MKTVCAKNMCAGCMACGQQIIAQIAECHP